MDLIIDLPKLNSIKLGEYALKGSNTSRCSLLMEGDIDMNELIFRSSESKIHYFGWRQFLLSSFSNSF